MTVICPVLHHPKAFDTKKYASRYLVDSDKDVPVVSYLRSDDQGNSSYVSWKAVEKRKNGLQQLDARARHSLAERPGRPGWNPVNIWFRGHQVTVMQRLGDFYTASDVMDPELLEIIHNYYDADTVYVGMPHACYMLASTAPEYLFNDFLVASDEAATEGVQFPEQVFRIDQGEISEILDVMPVGPEPELKFLKGEGILWFVEPYRGTFVHLDYMIRTDAHTYLPSFCADPNFSGKAIFEIPGDCPKFSEAEVRKLGDLEAMLNAVSAEEGWIAANGTAAMIRIRFSQRVKTVRGLDHNSLQRLKQSARDYDARQRGKRR